MRSKALAPRLALCAALVWVCPSTRANIATQHDLQQTALNTQYLETTVKCASTLAPAQCKRQAGLDFKQAQHALKIQQEARAVQARRLQLAQRATAQASTAPSQMRKSNDATQQSMERPPLLKRERANNTRPAPLSKPSKPHSPRSLSSTDQAATKPASAVDTPSRTVKPRLLEQLAPASKALPQAMVKSPNAAQRSANRSAAAAQQHIANARQANILEKITQRLTKDRSRQAAGFVVNKP